MRLFGMVVTAAALISGQALAQPVISSAVNSAGYMRPGLPNGGIAQSSYIAIFGTNLGPAVPGTGIVSATYPLQTTFQGVSAKIGNTNLFIVYATPTQVGAVVPGTTPLGNQQLTLTYNGGTSANFPVTVVARSFGLFTLNQAGTGPAVAFKYIAQGNEPVSTLFQASNPGGVITLYGTGAGAGSTPDDQQSTNPTIPGLDLSKDVEILVGNKKASIMYFGRPSWGSAIDQIVATLANDTPTGCYVSLVVRVAGITSNSTTVSVAPPGKNVCSDPNGYTEEQLTAAAAKGGIRVGNISLGKIASSVSAAGQSFNLVSDSLSGSFFSFTADQLIRSQGSASTLSIGSCQVFTFEGDNPGTVDPTTPTWLDAGAQLTATNSNGNQTLTKQSVGNYSKSISVGPSFPGVPSSPEYLTTGNHSVAGPGGTGVGSFNASVIWPAVFVWSNKDQTNIVNRANGVTVNWTGGDDSGYVSVVGFSAASISNKPVGAVFTCIEAANKHTLTVPAAITALLPVTATIEGSPMGNLSVTGISAPKSFTTAAPVLDVANIIYSSSHSKMVSFQ